MGRIPLARDMGGAEGGLSAGNARCQHITSIRSQGEPPSGKDPFPLHHEPHFIEETYFQTSLSFPLVLSPVSRGCATVKGEGGQISPNSLVCFARH